MKKMFTIYLKEHKHLPSEIIIKSHKFNTGGELYSTIQHSFLSVNGFSKKSLLNEIKDSIWIEILLDENRIRNGL